MKRIKKGLIVLVGILLVAASGGCSKKTDGSEVKNVSENAKNTEENTTPPPPPENQPEIPTHIDEPAPLIYGPPEMLDSNSQPIDSENSNIGEPELKNSNDDTPDKIINEYKKTPKNGEVVALYGVPTTLEVK